MNDNYVLDFVSCIKQAASQKQINADIKTLERTINMLRLTATLARGSSKKEINTYIRTLSSQLSTIKLKAKIDSKNLKSEINSALSKVSFKDIDILNIDGNKTKLKVKKVIADAKAYIEKNPVSIGINYENRRSKLDNDLTAYLNRNTKIAESSVLLKEADKVRNLIGAINDKKSLREATDAFQLYRSEVSATGFNTKSTTDKIKDMLEHVSKISSAFGVASIAVNNFVKSLKTLKYNDTILTEISKTSEMTKNQLKELGDEAFRVASKYGQLSSGYLLGVQDMARAGYENANIMAELSTKVQGAGDMTAELANQYIIATDKAYKMNGSIETLTTTLDGANNITNNNALTMSDLAEGMSIVGSQAASSGMKVNETTAALSTMIAVTQQGGSKMANAFKGILMNLQQVTGEVEDGGDAIDFESLTKYEKACNELGVSLSTVKDGIVSLREPMQIIKELSDAYTQLDESDARRANLLSSVGGKYRANALNAILENYDMYEKMLQDYEDGLGSMDEEAEKTAKSWEGRLNSLQNSWDSFINTLTNKEIALDGISFFDRLIQGAESLVDIVGEIPVVLAATNSSLVAMNKDYGITQLVNKDTGKFDVQGNIFGIDFTNIKNMKKHFSEASEEIKYWNKELSNGKGSLDSFSGSLVKNNAQFRAYLETTSKEAPASLSGYKTYLNAAGISTDALRIKTILLNSAISMGIGFAIQAAVQGITYLIQREEELRQATEEAANAYKETTSSIEDYTKRYQKLHQALIEAKGNEEETYNIKKQLLDLQTELNDKFGDEYGKLNLVTDAYKDQTKAIKAYNKEAAQTFLNENRKGIKQAEKEMTKERHYNLSPVGMSAFTKEGEALKEIAEQFKDQGVSLLDELGDGTYNKFTIHLNTDAQSAYNTINEFETALREKAEELGSENLFDNVLNFASVSANDAKSVLDDWGDIYQQSLMANIAKDDSLTSQMNEATKAVQDYNEAVLSSEDPFNDANVQKARENLTALKAEMQNEDGSWNEKWQKYASVIEDVFNQADTRLIDFDNAIKNDTSIQELANKLKGLNNLDVQGIADSLGGANRLQGVARQFAEITSSSDGVKNVVAELINYADEYGLETEELIDALTRLGYVQSEIQNSLSDQDSSKLFTITQTVDQLNTQIKPAFDSLKSAWQDIFTDEGFKLNSIDILSTCDSIKSKLDEMSEAGLSIDYSAFEDFVQVLNNAEATEQDVKDAFDGLASSITSAGLSGAEDFETLKSALEDLGIINDELVAFEALISNTDVLKEKGLDLADATEEQIRSFANEVVSAENLEQAIAMLTFQKELCALQGMDTSGEVANLLTLAENAGYTGEVIQYLTELEQLYQQVASGTLTPGQLDAKLARAEELQNLIKESASQINYEPKVDFSNVGGGKSGASKAAKEAADTYLESFEDELKGLKDLKDAGVITEKQYLDRLRALYVKYFKDKKQYAEEYAKYEREYLNGMKSLYESVFAHFISKINDRIKGIEDEKDAAVDALEEEKDAAEAAYQAEIDAIEKANKARERQLDLQQKQYNLEKLMNQKTVLLYSEGKGMHYENDMSGARKARDEVEKAKDEIRVAELEEMLEKSNAYYDELIEQTEKYYDTLIDALEKQKSKFEELQDLLDQAQMQAVLKELGINEEELLAGSEKEFNKLRDSYIGILADLNAGNSDVLSALSELSGMASLPSYLGETVNTVNALADSAGSLNSSLSGIDASAVNSDFDNMTASSSNAAGKVQSVTDALNNLSNDVSNYIIPPVNSDNFVSSFAEDGVILTTLTGFVERFKEICSDIPDIWNSTLSETFGEGGGSGDPLAGGLSNDTKYDALFEPILTALDTCKATMEEKLKECADTWVQFQTDLSEIIGVSGGSSDPEGNNGASAGAGQGTGKQRESSGSDTIVGTIQEGGTLIDESLNGEEGWAASFITAQDSIHGTAASIVECIESMVQEIVNACIAAIEAINMLERAKGGKGNHPTPQPYGRVGHSHAKGGSAFAEGTVGNAFATGTGYRGLPEAEKNALRSEYGQPELTLYPDGTTELTNQPIMSDLPKGTIIFNEEQTKKILNGKPYMKGVVSAYGAVKFEDGTIVRPNGEILAPPSDDDPFIQMQKKFEAYMMKMGGIEAATKSITDGVMQERNKEVDRFISQLNSGDIVTNNKNVQPNINNEFHITMPNVTNSTAAETLMRDLQSLRIKKYQVFD